MNVIHRCFEKQVAKTPFLPAVMCGVKSISYQELDFKATKLAAQLQVAGAELDLPIGICIPRSMDQLIGILAILKSGAGYVPLDSAQPKERLNLILSDLTILVTIREYAPLFNEFAGKIIFIDLPCSDSLRLNPAQTMAHNLAYIIYTSGSTGAPKGVLLEQHGIVNYCQWFLNYSAICAGQLIDYSSNYIFDMAVTTAIAPLLCGATIVICDEEIKKNPRAYLQYLQSKRIQLIKITPSYLRALLRELTDLKLKLPDLKTLILGGENLRTEDCAAWLDLFPEHVLFNEYGPTETSVAVLAHKVCKQTLDITKLNVPIGVPATEINCVIQAKNGEVGELYISGIGLARGYNKQPQLTQEKFIITENAIRFYKTGDLCRQREDGVIEYLGRIDRQLKVRGYRIEVSEIEVVLCRHPDIQDSVIIQEPHKQRLVAYYIAKNEIAYTELRDYLLKFLPDYMLPEIFMWLDKFPLTANGKLDEQAL